MAHPGIWGLAGLSVALIAAGVWLNRPDRAGTPFLTGGPEVAQPRPRAERPPEPLVLEPESEPAAAAVPEPAPDTMPEPEPQQAPLADLPPKDEALLPAPAAPQADSAPEPEPEPAPVPEPVPEPAPEPPANAVPPPDGTDASAGSPETATAAVDGTDGPRVFAGPDVWLLAPPDGVDPEAIAEAERLLAVTRLDGALAQGAAAISWARPDVLSARHGYNDLRQAEAHALEICAQIREDCVILAWRVPQDWDGSYENTLGTAQRAAWAEFEARPAGSYRAFAISAEGATGQAEGDTADLAHVRALAACIRDQERVRQFGLTASHCRVVALRGP